MNTRTRKLLLSGAGLLVAAGLGWTWWEAHGSQLDAGPDALPLVGIGAVACLVIAIGLQILRTGWLLGCRPMRLTQPLLMAHGMNVWLPSMMGDLFEVWAVARIAGRTRRGTLVLLGHRFTGTVAALAILAAVALGPVCPSLSAGLLAAAIVGYLLVDSSVGLWVRWLRVPADEGERLPRPLGPRRTLAHLGLAVVQHGVETAGIFLLGIAIGAAIPPSAAAGVVSIVEAVTYLPIPLGGAGANHWGASTVLEWTAPERNTALLVAAAHGLHVALGAAAIGISSLLPRDEAPPNTA